MTERPFWRWFRRSGSPTSSTSQGLQVPFCAADPVNGSLVNVTGTLNVLEAKRRSDGQVRGITYASSIGVFGEADMYEGGVAYDDSPAAPTTLYGAYKQANEWTARIYADDWGVGSVGLRPSVIYGLGRDQGLTSGATKVMLAAAAGRSGHIGYGGTVTYQHAQDMAAIFIAAARLDSETALVHNVGGPVADIAEIAAMIDATYPRHRNHLRHHPLPTALGDRRNRLGPESSTYRSGPWKMASRRRSTTSAASWPPDGSSGNRLRVDPGRPGLTPIRQDSCEHRSRPGTVQ